jgi:8-oxo-dGTP pyrophosphatase MutT (NUDIX family)
MGDYRNGDGRAAREGIPVTAALVHSYGYGFQRGRDDPGLTGVRVLMGRRAAGMDYAGLWCLPGGKIEEADGALWETACARELLEETGLRVRAASIDELCSFEVDVVCRGRDARASVIVGVVRLPADAGLARVVAPNELDALEWWSVRDCMRRIIEMTGISARAVCEFARCPAHTGSGS